MPPAIRVQSLGKRYRLGLTHARSLNELAARWTSRLRGESVQPAGLDNAESARTTGGDFWALQDINFEVAPGEVVGIIGRNGAGKSTLLKILSRVTRPTAGQVDLRGRVGSLLEVGTGFHPELTGRENVYMNGTLLGMTKREVARRFDEIVDFAGVERFIDTPVKRYSSGMKVRLGFAVAAHLEPEILIVDEVLAVGDAAFQRKCLGKMSDVASHGRTILFVSHNMAAVTNLCSRSIWLADGKIHREGSTQDIATAYFSSGATDEARIVWPDGYANEGVTDFSLQELRLTDSFGNETTHFATSQDLHIELTYRVTRNLRFCRVGIILNSVEGQAIFDAYDTDDSLCSGQRTPGVSTAQCIIPGGFLNVGGYTISVNAGIPNVRNLAHVPNAILLTVEDDSFGVTHGNVRRTGLVQTPTTWSEPISLETA